MENTLASPRLPMADKSQIYLPDDEYRLEEVNLSGNLSRSLVGKSLLVEVLPEELPGTRKVDPNDVPCLIDEDGTHWNDYHPVRISFTDSDGRVWRLPRNWLKQDTTPDESEIQETYSVTNEIVFDETINLPTEWDLWEINIPWSESARAPRRMQNVRVQLSPDQPAKVLWRDSSGNFWRIPHNWRRRRIRLPRCEVLTAQGIPDDVAERFSEKAVSVNYHPGSLCCLPAQYRFRDEMGNRWPVFKENCICLLYTSPSPRDLSTSRMPSSA